MQKVIYGCLFLVLIFCQNEEKKRLKEGKYLANTHCQACHLVPDPQDLTKKVWEKEVLPKMGARLGMKTTQSEIKNGMNLPRAWSVSR